MCLCRHVGGGGGGSCELEGRQPPGVRTGGTFRVGEQKGQGESGRLDGGGMTGEEYGPS